MTGQSIEPTLELWACSLRDVKARMRPPFTQERVAASASRFLDGLLGNERRKQDGLDALCDRSRRPVRYANQLPYQIERMIVRFKQDKPHWPCAQDP